MSDNPREKPAPGAQTPSEAGYPPFPAQEFFGPPFPESPPASPITAGLPDQAQAMSGAPFAFVPPPPFAQPPISSYPVPAGIVAPPPGILHPAPHPLPPGEALRQLPGQYRNVLTHPTAATCAWEQSKVAWNIIWLQVLVLTIVESLVVLALLFLESFLFQFLLPSGTSGFLSRTQPMVVIIVLLFCVAYVPASFFSGSGLLYLAARACGGRGAFLPYAYSYALITVPAGILTLLFSLHWFPCPDCWRGGQCSAFDLYDDGSPPPQRGQSFGCCAHSHWHWHPAADRGIYRLHCLDLLSVLHAARYKIVQHTQGGWPYALT
jgi:hypothetical protein